MAIRGTNLLRILTLLLLLALGSFPSWGADSEPASGPGGSGSLENESAPTYNDYALLLAGLSNREGRLETEEGKTAWGNYARSMDQRWEIFEKKQLAPMREWAARELGAAQTATVFYPFSGPDFVNVYTLFPHAKTYLLIALEPVGKLPDFAAINQPGFFASLQRSLYEYLYIDFFSTARMEASIARTQLKGVLPVLLVFLAREKARVLDMRYWVMKPDGTMEEAPAVDGESLSPGIPGVRIVFEGAGSAGKQTLYYFRFNLQNNSFDRSQQFVFFLKGFAPFTTFTKAASYLMFSPYSSGIRQFILDQSQYVLQGDSGIPLKYFDPAVWNLKFYGTYAGPINLFRNRYQKDLAEIYNQGKDVYPLPFGIGYRFRAGTSNLMFASKKAEFTPTSD
jgi:hypothetical protein